MFTSFVDWTIEMLAWWFMSLAIYRRYGCWRVHCSCSSCKASEGWFFCKLLLIYVSNIYSIYLLPVGALTVVVDPCLSLQLSFHILLMYNLSLVL